MANFIAFGEKGERGKPVETAFINLDQICSGKYFNPTSGTGGQSTLELVMSNNQTINLGGEAASAMIDAITRQMVDLSKKPKG